MRYVDEFRDAELGRAVAAEIASTVDAGRHYKVMEVCGGLRWQRQAHAIVRRHRKRLHVLVHAGGTLWPSVVLPNPVRAFGVYTAVAMVDVKELAAERARCGERVRRIGADLATAIADPIDYADELVVEIARELLNLRNHAQARAGVALLG